MKGSERKEIIQNATADDIATALKNLRLGKATKIEQIIANYFYQEKISSQANELSSIDQNRKNIRKRWQKWRRMELVHDLVHNPSLDEVISRLEPQSFNQAYKIVADIEGVNSDTIRRDYERLKKGLTEQQLKNEITKNVSKLWLTLVRGK